MYLAVAYNSLVVVPVTAVLTSLRQAPMRHLTPASLDDTQSSNGIGWKLCENKVGFFVSTSAQFYQGWWYSKVASSCLNQCTVVQLCNLGRLLAEALELPEKEASK